MALTTRDLAAFPPGHFTLYLSAGARRGTGEAGLASCNLACN